MRRFLMKGALALGVVTLACSSGDITAPATDTVGTANVPASVVITPPASSDVIVGSVLNLVAAVKNASGQNISNVVVTWSSSDATVASVSPAGVLTALKVGTTLITGSASGRSSSITINVKAIPVNRVDVTVRTTLIVGESATAVATATDANGNTLAGRAVAWTSRNPGAATVSATGVVTAVGAGSAGIDAVVDGVLGSANVVVTPARVAIGSITVTMADLILRSVGANTMASAVVRDPAGNTLTDRVITWSSSNTDVASVSQLGVVTSIGLGTATITASSEGTTGSANIVVTFPLNAPIATIGLSSGNLTLNPGRTAQVSATVRDISGNVITDRPTVWQSSNAAAATVSQTGLITAVSVGSAQISATVEGRSSTLTVQVVSAPLASLTLAGTNVLQPTQTSQLTPTFRDTDNNVVTGSPIVWTSSTPTVATVSASGLVTAFARGTTIITATSGSLSGTLTISVPPVATINVTAPAVRLQPTQSTQATVALLDASSNPATNRAVVWTSSAPAIATVSAAGLVNAIAPGTTTITVTSEGVTGTLLITVPPVAVINVTATAVTLQPTGTTQATGALLDALNAPVTGRTSVWASSAPAVATVSQSGLITAIAPGTTNITLTSEGVTGTLVITVPPVATVTVAVGTNFLLVGQTTNATATLRDASNNLATNRAVTWSSGTPTVATISPLGVITVASVGTTVITATSEGKTGTLTFTVVPPVGSIAINGGPASMLVSETGQLNGVILDTFNNPYTGAFTWSSSDPSRMTVSQTGLVSAVGSGSQATITISLVAGGVTQTRNITLVGRRPETLAELPRVFLNTAAPPAPDVGGTVYTVAVGATPTISAANLQAALNAAQPGDVVELPNGASFTGNFILPFRSGATTKWVTIRPVSRAGMPAEGQRMTPTIAAAVNLPKIISPNNQAALEPAKGAHHFRIIGIEFTVPSNILSTGIVRFDANQLNLSQVPHNLVLDRSYVHGTTTGSVTRCVALNSASSAVIDSHMSDCHSLSDAQAIGGWSGPGPFKIVNNYLESSGENIMFGGADPGITNLVPADIEIRRNHFFKPVVWQNPDLWTVKNLFELKSAARVLVEGNIFENNWNDAQTGYAINIKSSNQDGACTACGSTDVTFRLNLVRNTGAGMVLSGAPDPLPTTNHLARVTVTDNIFHSLNTGVFTGDGNAILLNNDPADIVIHHNTMIGATAAAVSFGGPQGAIIRGTIRDNIITGGSNGVKGSSVAAGTNSINAFLPGGTFAANAIILSSNVAAYPTNNLYPASNTAAGFVNAAAFDFRLAANSTLRGKGTDGSDLGADIAAVNAAIAGVIVP